MLSGPKQVQYTHISALRVQIPFDVIISFYVAIITAAMEMLGGKDVAKMCRKPEIMSDAGMSA